MPDLPLGKVSVLVNIAAEESKGKMIQAGETTFRSAIDIAQKLPARPETAPGVRRPQTPLGVHFRDEAFEKIVRAAIHVRNVKIVTDAAKTWSRSGDKVDSVIVGAWFAEGRTDEAIDAARRIEEPERRVSELLSLAGNLLNEAGGPIF